jgi:hypothetical protein
MKEESLRDSTATPNESCTGTHRYFVATEFGVEGEGAVGIVVVCTACGDCFVKKFSVANSNSPLKLKEK